ncbi:hypothetical protein SprV_0401629000 [Sparganum proliferum]
MVRVTDEVILEAFAVTSRVEQGCVFFPTISKSMFSVMLIGAHGDERPGIRLAYRNDGRILSSQRLQTQTRLFTTTVHDLLLANGCSICIASEADIKLNQHEDLERPHTGPIGLEKDSEDWSNNLRDQAGRRRQRLKRGSRDSDVPDPQRRNQTAPKMPALSTNIPRANRPRPTFQTQCTNNAPKDPNCYILKCLCSNPTASTVTALPTGDHNPAAPPPWITGIFIKPAIA